MTRNSAIKTCKSCGDEKPIDSFHVDSKSRDGRHASCKRCRKKYTDKYNSQNRDRINARQREYNKIPTVRDRHKIWCSQYYQENKESISKRKTEWVENNRDKVRESSKKSQRRALKDPVKAEKHRMRSRIAMAVSSNGFRNKPKTEKLIGCSWVDFLAHIESLFRDGMSWDNRHLWHIDHIVPLDSAQTIEEMSALCHYTNLQPLWARDNLSKGARVDHCSY